MEKTVDRLFHAISAWMSVDVGSLDRAWSVGELEEGSGEGWKAESAKGILWEFRLLAEIEGNIAGWSEEVSFV